MKRKQQEKKKKRQNELSIIDPILVQTKQIKSTSRFFKQIYGCAYARRYKVNQATKGGPGVIKAATNDINNIAEKRTNQIISEVGKVIDCVLPEIVRGTTEDVYQTPLRILGEFFYLSFMTQWKHFQKLHKPLKTLLSKIISTINYS